jgi:flagellar assembly protein FliH
MPEPRPFRFDDLRADDEAPPPLYTAADVAAAREDGIREGRRIAMESIAADEAAALARIGDELARLSVEPEIARARAEIAAVARAFLEAFCESIAQAREIALAEDLLRRLTQNSEDRRSAALIVSARRFERLERRLLDLVERRGLADFVRLDFDHELAPGEARLEWRGGSVRRGRAEIEAAVASLFDSLPFDHLEPDDERA